MLNQEVLDIIGTEIRFLRTNKKLSLRTLSEMSGVSKSTINRIENGSDCGLDKLVAICKSLGVDYVDLVQRASDGYGLISNKSMHQLRKSMLNIEDAWSHHLQKYEELIGLYNSLTPDQQELVKNLMRSMIQ